MHGTSGQQKSQLWLANTILETETPPAMRADVYYAQKSCDHSIVGYNLNDEQKPSVIN